MSIDDGLNPSPIAFLNKMLQKHCSRGAKQEILERVVQNSRRIFQAAVWKIQWTTMNRAQELVATEEAPVATTSAGTKWHKTVRWYLESSMFSVVVHKVKGLRKTDVKQTNKKINISLSVHHL